MPNITKSSRMGWRTTQNRRRGAQWLRSYRRQGITGHQINRRGLIAADDLYRYLTVIVGRAGD